MSIHASASEPANRTSILRPSSRSGRHGLFRLRSGLVALPLLVAACAAPTGAPESDAPDERTGSSESSVVTPGAVATSSWRTTALPALPANGRMPEGGVFDASAGVVHGASYSNGSNLGAAPTVTPAGGDPAATRNAWLSSAVPPMQADCTPAQRTAGSALCVDQALCTAGQCLSPTDARSYAMTPAAPAQLRAAVANAEAGLSTDMDTLSEEIGTAGSTLNSLIGTVNAVAQYAGSAFNIPVGVTTTSNPVQTQFVGYTPAYTRWTDVGGGATGKGLDYAEPDAMGAMRLRGAKMYCAAREAVRQQNNALQSGSLHPMGAHEGVGFSILGTRMSFLTAQPFATFDSPRKFAAASNDGAQAFVVPLDQGVELSLLRVNNRDVGGPIHLSSPVRFVMGDSEAVASMSHLVGTPPLQYYSNDGAVRSGWTVEAITTASKSDSIRFGFPIFSIGVPGASLGVYGNLTFGVQQGVLSADNDRLLGYRAGGAALPGGFPTAVRDLEGFDTFWSLGSYGTTTPGALVPATVQAHSGMFWDTPRTKSLSTSNPFLHRALQDDDRHLRLGTSASLSAGVSGMGQLGTSWLGVSVSAFGNVTGAMGVENNIRHGVSAQRQDFGIDPDNAWRNTFYGVNELSIEPKSVRSIEGNVGFSVTLNLPWDSYSYTRSVPLGRAESRSGRWTENGMIRVRDGSEQVTVGHDPLRQPDAYSHLANGPDFPAFPESVDTCLAGAEVVAAPVARACTVNTDPKATGLSLPRANLCVYSATPPIDPDTSVCSSSGYLAVAAARGASTPAQISCIQKVTALVCDPGSTFDNFRGQRVRSRILDPNDGKFAARLGDAMQTCQDAYGTGKVGRSWVQANIGVDLCRDNADLIDDGEFLAPLDAPAEGPGAITDPACHYYRGT